MSPTNPPDISAAWLEGFLKGSGTILLFDNELSSVINNWVNGVGEELFIQVLPLLRRTFANFSPTKRRKLGEKVKSGSTTSRLVIKESSFNHERAKQGIPIVLQILHLQKKINLVEQRISYR